MSIVLALGRVNGRLSAHDGHSSCPPSAGLGSQSRPWRVRHMEAARDGPGRMGGGGGVSREQGPVSCRCADEGDAVLMVSTSDLSKITLVTTL